MTANKPLTHEERRRLIETPLTFRTLPRSMPWAGVLIEDGGYEVRRSVYTDDEEWGSIGNTRKTVEG